MEELSELQEQIEYYERKAKDVTDMTEYDNAIDSLRYYENLKNELGKRLLQLRVWENYLSAIEKTKMMELGGDSDTFSLTTLEKTAMKFLDRDETKMIRK